ncbi:MAG: M23 family metallopeptidase [Bacteroidales bacterium]|jgi:murein DD-endopeptidase MepM/ murein hydrolase activator NlpD|nr:M23 family metallopeptidase [Bacteroidales bacterium]
MKSFFKQWYNRLFSNVHDKYRLVVMNETFQEKFSFRLSRLNVFVTMGMTALILIVGTITLISFTSLREFIPGYTKDEVTRMAYHNQSKIDSLEMLVNAQEKLLYAMDMAISGKIPIETVEDIQDSIVLHNYDQITYERSKEDDELRNQIEQGEKFNLAQQNSEFIVEAEILQNSSEPSQSKVSFNTQSGSQIFYYVPLEGTIVGDFDEYNKHFGIDITGKKDDVVKAIQKGTVISSEWTADGGYVITIQHENNVLSLYKYNSAVLKRAGDNVEAGEPIAFIGNSGEDYKGPILHFELWYNGLPVNPRDYIAF